MELNLCVAIAIATIISILRGCVFYIAFSEDAPISLSILSGASTFVFIVASFCIGEDKTGVLILLILMACFFMSAIPLFIEVFFIIGFCLALYKSIFKKEKFSFAAILNSIVPDEHFSKEDFEELKRGHYRVLGED